MRGRKRTGRNENGAVAVEAALVTPLIMLMLFGIVEMALLMRDAVAVSSAVRTGGRTASALAGAGPAGVDENGYCQVPCSGTNAPRLAQLAASAIQQAGSAMPKDSIQKLWIYKANDKGFPGTQATDANWACTTNCIEYRWVPAADKFKYWRGTWTSSTIKACANQTPDAVGIYLEARHSFITGFFSNGVMVDDYSVFAFEPLPTLTCDSGTHP